MQREYKQNIKWLNLFLKMHAWFTMLFIQPSSGKTAVIILFYSKKLWFLQQKQASHFSNKVSLWNIITLSSRLICTRHKLSFPSFSHKYEFLVFSATELIIMGGINRMNNVEKYDIDGNLVETLPSFTNGR